LQPAAKPILPCSSKPWLFGRAGGEGCARLRRIAVVDDHHALDRGIGEGRLDRRHQQRPGVEADHGNPDSTLRADGFQRGLALDRAEVRPAADRRQRRPANERPK